MSYIGREPKSGDYFLLDDISGGFNGTDTAFSTTVQGIPHKLQKETQCIVILNDQVLKPVQDYTVSDYEIIFTTAPTTGAEISITSLGNVYDELNFPSSPIPEIGTVRYALAQKSGVFIEESSRFTYYVADGGSIGKLGSSAITADARLENLYYHLWEENYTVSGGRGTSARADWLAGKGLNVPDLGMGNQQAWVFTGLVDTSVQPNSISADSLTINASIGQIAAFVGNPGTSWLLCDGSTLPEEFSLLREHLGTNTVPDFRNRFLYGSTTEGVLSTGGSSRVTLTVGQLPRHTHSVTETPHTHAYRDTSSNESGQGFPGSGNLNHVRNESRVTDPSTTGISINETGNNDSHENMPPYAVVRYYICATNAPAPVENIEPLSVGVARWSSDERANTEGIYIDASGMYWVSPRGQSLGRTSGDMRGQEYEKFYRYLWRQSYTSLVSGQKSTADNDWNSNRLIRLPNLNGRFLRQSTSSTLGATGGSENKTLSVNELPPHTHSYRRVSSGSGGEQGFVYDNGFTGLVPNDLGGINPTGSGNSFSILPPYFTMTLQWFTGVRMGQPTSAEPNTTVQRWTPAGGDWRDSWGDLSPGTNLNYNLNTKLATLTINATRNGSLENRVGENDLLVLPEFLRPGDTFTDTVLLRGAGGAKYISLIVSSDGNVRWSPLDPLPAGTSAQLLGNYSFYIG